MALSFFRSVLKAYRLHKGLVKVVYPPFLAFLNKVGKFVLLKKYIIIQNKIIFYIKIIFYFLIGKCAKIMYLTYKIINGQGDCTIHEKTWENEILSLFSPRGKWQ